MEGFSLTSNELQELRAAHRSSVSKRDAYKVNSVILLGQGWTLEETSEALLLDEETLRGYVNKYRAGGFCGLIKTNYKGSQPKLSDDQVKILCAELDENIYPTTKLIQVFIKEQFLIDYTISGLTDLLHRLGYVYKKPKLVPGNPNIDDQEIFLRQFEEFMNKKPSNEAVFFVDAVHPTHNTVASYGWIRKGKEQILQSNSGRSRYNIHGAMNAETYETTVVTGEENVNAESTIALFQLLENQYPL